MRTTSGHLIFGVQTMIQKEHQAPLTIEEQLRNLKELGLIIEDEAFAKHFLNDVSYFRLIKGYSLGLKPKNGQYTQGTTFSQLVQLYKFNCKFRQLLFPQIERIEINLRCRVANHFSSQYGVLGYEDPANFQNPAYHESFLKEIEQEISRNKRSPFIRNFQNNYKDSKIPMYALVELFSFGTLSKFFKNLKSTDKKAIAASYHIAYPYLESWIESIAYVRNLCAHYGRLYNAKLTKTPNLYKQHTHAGIKNIRVFSVLVCISLLLPRDAQWETFLVELEMLIRKYPSVQIETMGFPENWKEFLSAPALLSV